MHRFTLAATLAVCFASLGWAGAESYFQERTFDFGATPRGPQLTHYFKFTNVSKDTLVIGGVRVSCGCVTASAPVTTIKPGETSYITAHMDTRRFVGDKSVTVYVQFTSPRFEEVSLVVKANGRDDLSMSSDTLAFGSVRKGSTNKASVQLTFNSDANWKVENVKSDSSYVGVEAKLVKSNGSQVTYEITGTLKPDLPVGRWYTDFWVQTNHPTMGKTRVPVTVDVTAAVVASPESLQLGDVKVGDSVEQNITIRGDKPFKIKAVKGGESVVQVSGMNGDAKKIHVLKFEFKPAAPGEVDRAVAIITDESDEPAVTIPLKAKAIKD